jgi:predicted peroxiredoxin
MPTPTNSRARSTTFGLVAILIASWTFFLVGGAGASGDTVTPPKVSKVLFINVQSGYEDLHRVNMAFQMARNQRLAGRPVTMFFNINAPVLATKDLPSAWRWKDYAPIKDQVAELIAAGVKVLVCPTCSADQGVTAGDLVPGAQMTNPQLTGSQLKPGTVTLTY